MPVVVIPYLTKFFFIVPHLPKTPKEENKVNLSECLYVYQHIIKRKLDIITNQVIQYLKDNHSLWDIQNRTHFQILLKLDNSIVIIALIIKVYFYMMRNKFHSVLFFP